MNPRERGRANAPPAWLAATLLVALVVPLNGGHSQDSAPSASEIRDDLDSGRYDRAETVARALVRSLEHSADAADATDLFVESLWRNGRSGVEIVALAEKAAAERVRIAAPNDPKLANSFANLGQALLLSGEYARAVTLFTRAITTLEGSPAQNQIPLANALDDLARALLFEAKYDEAGRALERALQIKENTLKEDDPQLAATLELSASLFQRRADYVRARPRLERAVAIRSRASPNHPALAAGLGLLGDQYWFEGAVQESADVYRRALSLAEATLRAGHPEIAMALKNLATAELALGGLSETLTLRTRALAIAETAFGADHPAIAGYANDLANGYMAQQNYSSARALFERALAIMERHLGAEHESVATSVFNLAFLDGQLGDLAETERLTTRAVRIWEKRLGPDHPFVARAWHRLGEVLLEHHRTADALPVLRRALDIRERALGAEHLDVARTLLQIALASMQLGRPADAERLSARAAAIWERASAGAPGHATALFLRAQIVASTGNHREARALYERSMAIRTGVFGPSHLDVAKTQHGLAIVLGHLDEADAAVATALQAAAAARATLRSTVRYLPERQALQYSDLAPASVDVAIALLSTGTRGGDATRAFDEVVQGRSLILDEMAARQRSAIDPKRPELAPLWSNVFSARQRLANLAVRAPSEQRPGQYIAILDAARRNKETAERALAERSGAFKEELARADASLDAVRSSLSSQDALVSFVRYERPISGPAAQSRRVAAYAAFVLAPDSSAPAVVQLGSANALERAIAAWRREAATGVFRQRPRAATKTAYRGAGERLRVLLWDPVSRYVGSARRVFVVPDGAINLVNLAALPIGSSEYLIERAPTLHYLSAERDLVEGLGDERRGIGLFTLGGPNFNDGSAFTRLADRPSGVLANRETSVPPNMRGTGPACGTLQSLVFGALPETLGEAKEIASLWNAASTAESSHQGDAELAIGAKATERAFVERAPGRRVLHLATHGFFLGSACDPRAAGSRAVGGLTSGRASPPSKLSTENPLLMSGLAFAGANRRANAGPEEDDGILTAEEIAGMNLDGTEWAVLSACDTGLGEVRAGEGVFGLRRAFQVAGVRTIIMSLWSVEDQATRQWMRALYEARLIDRLDTADSVRAASLRVMRDRRSKGLNTHPFYWAAFVAAGDWR